MSFFIVPKAGLEPALGYPKLDFESSASTNSATSAFYIKLPVFLKFHQQTVYFTKRTFLINLKYKYNYNWVLFKQISQLKECCVISNLSNCSN